MHKKTNYTPLTSTFCKGEVATNKFVYSFFAECIHYTFLLQEETEYYFQDEHGDADSLRTPAVPQVLLCA